MASSQKQGIRKGEWAFILAMIVGLVIGILIKRIRIGLMIGLVLGIMILLTGWLRMTRR